MAAITVAELWHGVERATGSHKARRLQYLQTVLAPLPILSYTEQTAHEHARIWAQLEAAGKMIWPHTFESLKGGGRTNHEWTRMNTNSHAVSPQGPWK